MPGARTFLTRPQPQQATSGERIELMEGGAFGAQASDNLSLPQPSSRSTPQGHLPSLGRARRLSHDAGREAARPGRKASLDAAPAMRLGGEVAGLGAKAGMAVSASNLAVAARDREEKEGLRSGATLAPARSMALAGAKGGMGERSLSGLLAPAGSRLAGDGRRGRPSSGFLSPAGSRSDLANEKSGRRALSPAGSRSELADGKRGRSKEHGGEARSRSSSRLDLSAEHRGGEAKSRSSSRLNLATENGGSQPKSRSSSRLNLSTEHGGSQPKSRSSSRLNLSTEHGGSEAKSRSSPRLNLFKSRSSISKKSKTGSESEKATEKAKGAHEPKPTALLPSILSVDSGHAAEIVQARDFGIVNMPFSAWGENYLRDLDSKLQDETRFFGSKTPRTASPASTARSSAAGKRPLPKSRLEQALMLGQPEVVEPEETIEVTDVVTRPGTAVAVPAPQLLDAKKTAEMEGIPVLRLTKSRSKETLTSHSSALNIPTFTIVPPTESNPAAPEIQVQAPPAPSHIPALIAPLISVQAPDATESVPIKCDNPPTASPAAAIPIFIVTDTDETAEQKEEKPYWSAYEDPDDDNWFPNHHNGASSPRYSGRCTPRISRWELNQDASLSPGTRSPKFRPGTAARQSSVIVDSQSGSPPRFGSARGPSREQLIEEDFHSRLRNIALVEKEERLVEELTGKRNALRAAKSEIMLATEEGELYREHLIEIQRSIGELLAQTIQLVHQLAQQGIASSSKTNQRLSVAVGNRGEKATTSSPTVSIHHLTGLPFATDLDTQLKQVSADCVKYAETVHDAIGAAAREQAAGMLRALSVHDPSPATANLTKARKRNRRKSGKVEVAAPAPISPLIVWAMPPPQREAAVMATARIRFLANQASDATKSLSTFLATLTTLFTAGSTESVDRRPAKELGGLLPKNVLLTASNGTVGSRKGKGRRPSDADTRRRRAGSFVGGGLTVDKDANGNLRRKSGVFQVYGALAPEPQSESNPRAGQVAAGPLLTPSNLTAAASVRRSSALSGAGSASGAAPPLLSINRDEGDTDVLEPGTIPPRWRRAVQNLPALA
ncbi:hypothetical protein HDU96_010733 [Phlyctochytrium bullatum]|nr:hypothetical protein HDU96_010733 [Phlyctochytrium bullatum]